MGKDNPPSVPARRKGERRKQSDRRELVRYEPDKEPRRSLSDRRRLDSPRRDVPPVASPPRAPSVSAAGKDQPPLSLVVMRGAQRIAERPLVPGTLNIGRSADNDVCLDSPQVSDRHARLVSYFQAIYVQDLGSTSGTFLRGNRVTIHTLQPGDELAIGDFRLVIQLRPSGGERAAPGADQTQILSRAELEKLLAGRTPEAAGPKKGDDDAAVQQASRPKPASGGRDPD